MMKVEKGDWLRAACEAARTLFRRRPVPAPFFGRMLSGANWVRPDGRSAGGVPWLVSGPR